MSHLFITIKDSTVEFLSPEVNGSDPAPNDARKLQAVIDIVRHYGSGTVEIRDDRSDDFEDLIAAQNFNADTMAGVQYV
jgi:hypothetical protein